MRRRDALILGGAVAVALAIPQILRRRSDDFVFSELRAIPGFRRLERGEISAFPDMFSGLRTDGERAADARLPKNICAAVFPESVLQDSVPVAVFSDYYCPYCAVFDRRLAKLQSDGALIDLRFHELPLLGERSRWAARVALAAGDQSNHTEVHLHMMQRNLRPGMAGIKDIAQQFDLDADLVTADATGIDMDTRIEDALALGRTLGIPGTPGAMIGRTLVVGALAQGDLERLIALESEQPFVGCS